MLRDLLDLLESTCGVNESPRWHPERDVLCHQLQSFELARAETNDCALWAAALLHDVGKAVGFPHHAAIGAELLDGLISPRVVWLVRHHLDLRRNPRGTKRRLAGSPALRDLKQLRRWDVRGRIPNRIVIDPDEAVSLLLDASGSGLLDPVAGEPAPCDDARKKEWIG